MWDCKLLFERLGNILIIKISKEGKIVPKDSSLDLNDFNIEIIYCLGCSWNGPVSSLI